MPKYLAVEWDDHEVRLVIANQRGREAVLEQAFAVPLPATADGLPPKTEVVARTLREALGSQNTKRLETLAAVGRPSIELKDLVLPPAPDDELPEMVRFQAMRDFTHLGDDWPLDFIPLPAKADEQRGVLAAAISPETLAELQAVCQQAGVEMSHLVLRPCSAAALLTRRQPGSDQVRMLIDLLGDEVDLTALVGDTPIFMRTARLPIDSSLPESTRPLIAEVRRTMAAVHNRLKDRRVESITLCGDGPHQNALTEQMTRELDLPTQLFDPFKGFELAEGLGRALPTHRSRYAPLLGMIATAAAEERHTLDFLDPRKRPVAKTRRRELAWAAGAVGGSLFLLAAYTWWQVSRLDGEIAELKYRNEQLAKRVAVTDKVKKDMTELDKWVAGDVPWLDVLAKVSTRAPKSEEAILTNFKASSLTKGDGVLQLQGLVRTHDALSNLETGLRDAPHKVVVNGIDRDDSKKRYPWAFKASVSIDTAKLEALKQETAKSEGAKSAGKKIASKPDAEKVDKINTDPAKADTNKADVAKPESPKTETPKTETPKTDTPTADTSKLDASKLDGAKIGAAKIDAAKPSSIKTDSPKTESTPADTTNQAKSDTKTVAEPATGKSSTVGGP